MPETQSSDGTTTVILKQQPSGGWFAWLGWLAFLLCIPVIITMWSAYEDYFNDDEGITEVYHSLSKDADDKIAIIKATGVLADANGFAKKQINRIRDDEDVKAIVLRVNSPGGTITASDYIYHHLNELVADSELPIVVSMGGIAASGGYYISMAVGDTEDSIFAEPTTTTGSIGVIVPHYDVSGLLEDYNIKNDSIVSHPRKNMLSMTKSVSEEDRAIMQDYVNQSFERFKEIVKAGRPVFRDNDAALSELATGEVFTAQEALESGLVDKIGFIEEAIERAADLAGISVDNVKAITYSRPVSLTDSLGLAQTQSSEGRLLNSILELSTPRAYYLYSSLPGLGIDSTQAEAVER